MRVVPAAELGTARLLEVFNAGFSDYLVPLRLDEDALRAHVRDNLARYKVPRDFVFVDELPRNPTGKILKAQLAAR